MEKHHKSIQQILRYLVTGFTAFGIEYGLYVLLLQLFNMPYLLASVLVYVIVFWFVFFVNRTWSFQSNSNIKRQLILYIMLFTFNLFVANVVLMYMLTDILGLSAYLSPFIKTGMVVSWNFLAYKYIIYK